MQYGNSLVAVGGPINNNIQSNLLHKLTCPPQFSSMDKCKWELMEQKLKTGRQYPVASMIQDKLVTCHWSNESFNVSFITKRQNH